jgi:hypothetical protein
MKSLYQCWLVHHVPNCFWSYKPLKSIISQWKLHMKSTGSPSQLGSGAERSPSRTVTWQDFGWMGTLEIWYIYIYTYNIRYMIYYIVYIYIFVYIYMYVCMCIQYVYIYIWVCLKMVYTPQKRTFIGVNNDKSWDFVVAYFQRTPI